MSNEENEEKWMQFLEKCRKCSAIIGGLFALGIAIPFTVVYAHQYQHLRDSQI